MVKSDQTRTQMSNKKEDKRASLPTGHIKPKSLDMDALAAGDDNDILAGDGSALKPAPRSALPGHRRGQSNVSDAASTGSGQEKTPVSPLAAGGGVSHTRNQSFGENLGAGTSQTNSDEGDEEAGGASIVINEVYEGSSGDEKEADASEKAVGNDNLEAEELTPRQRMWNRCLICFFHLHTSIIFQVIVLLSSIIALLAADVSLLTFQRSTESIVDVLLGCSAVFLFLDLIVCLQIRRGYSYTILSFMDFIAVLSIVIEIRWVFQVLLIFFAKTDSFENFFGVMSEIAESARLTNVPKILRIALQLFSHCFDIEGYVADVNYIIGDDKEEEEIAKAKAKTAATTTTTAHSAKAKRKSANLGNSGGPSGGDKYADLKIVLPDDLKAGSLRTIEDDEDGQNGGHHELRDRSESQLSLSSISSESDYEYEDEDNDTYVFRQEGLMRHKIGMKQSPAADEAVDTAAQIETKNRAKIPGSTLILAVDKIASPWLHEIGTVVLEFMTARMVLMLLLFMLIVRLLQNNKPSNQKELGLRMLDGFAAADPNMNSTEFSIALNEYTLRHDGTDQKGTFYNKDQPLAYLRVNGVDLLDAVDVRTLYGRREDELEYTILRGICARPPINERFARLILLRECRSIAVWDNRRILARAATNNILKTVFITCTLALGMFMIGYDLNVLVLDPNDSMYQMGKDMLFSINWSGIGEAMKAAEVEEQEEGLDEYQRNVRNIARHIIMAGDLFVRSKPILNEQFVNFRETAVDLDARYGKNKEDLVPAVDGIIHNINPTVEAVKLIVDGVDAVMVPTVGDIDIYAPARRGSTDAESSGRGGGPLRHRRGTTVHNDRIGVARPTHGYHRAQRRGSGVERRGTLHSVRSSGISMRRPHPSDVGGNRSRAPTGDRVISPTRRDSYSHGEREANERRRVGSFGKSPTSKIFRRKLSTDPEMVATTMSLSRHGSFSSSTPPSSRHNSLVSSPIGSPVRSGSAHRPHRRSRGSRSGSHADDDARTPNSHISSRPVDASAASTTSTASGVRGAAAAGGGGSFTPLQLSPRDQRRRPPPPPQQQQQPSRGEVRTATAANLVSPDVRSSLSTLDRALDLLNDETFELLEEGNL